MARMITANTVSTGRNAYRWLAVLGAILLALAAWMHVPAAFADDYGYDSYDDYDYYDGYDDSASYEDDGYREDISDYTIFSSFTSSGNPTIPVQAYTGSPVKPKISVGIEDEDSYDPYDDYDDPSWYYETLTQGVDYTVSYANNVNVGTATVTVTGIGDYTGTLKRNFKIAYPLAKAKVASIKNQKYTGKAVKPKPAVTYKGAKLRLNTDYKLSYKNNKSGVATVTVTGRGNYTGTLSKTFKIVTPISKAKVASVSAKKYTGKAIKPTPKVKVAGKTLKKGADYTLSYKNNKKAGTAKIVIKGKGAYKGTKTVAFKIKKAKSKSKASGGSGTVYITNTGEKYHRGSCKWLRYSKIPISKSEAIAEGYGACKVCRP